MGFKKFTLLEDVDITQMADATSVTGTQSEATETEEETTEVTEVEETETEETTENESVPAKFFSKLFESREIAHIYHLQSKGDSSHAAHLALQDYYEGVLELIDDLVEVYQGQYEIVEGYENLDLKEVSTDKVQYFISLAEFVKSTRNSALSEEDVHLQALVDDILILIYKTLYKLRFNK